MSPVKRKIESTSNTFPDNDENRKAMDGGMDLPARSISAFDIQANSRQKRGTSRLPSDGAGRALRGAFRLMGSIIRG
jgi:hypothetical protein